MSIQATDHTTGPKKLLLWWKVYASIRGRVSVSIYVHAIDRPRCAKIECEEKSSAERTTMLLRHGPTMGES